MVRDEDRSSILSHRRQSVWGMILLVVALGCGQGRPNYVLVSGEVTFDGQPVEVGQIRFTPAAGTSGPITISAIRQGQYTTEKTSGVPIGNHRVGIRAFDPDEYNNRPKGPGSPPLRQLLPEKYNGRSDLTVAIETGQRRATENFHLEP